MPDFPYDGKAVKSGVLIMKVSLRFLSLLSLLSLCACADIFESHSFGVPQSTWDKMSPEERSTAIESYHQQRILEIEAQRRRQEIDAQNAPMNNMINVLGGVLSTIAEDDGHKPSHSQGASNASAATTMPSMPSANFASGDCQETVKVVNGVTYREKKCYHEESHKSSSTSFKAF